MIPKDGINLPYVKEVFRRRFWYIVLPFFFVFTGTVLYCIKAPKIYQSSTLILVQPQEVPTDYVRPTVTSDPVSRMNLLTEQVMSRPRFEEIIKKHNLYPKILSTYTMYDAVEKMRQDVHLEVKESESQQTKEASPIAFEISYEGPEPATVRDVTTSIADLFIEDNVKLREQQAAGTSKFLERELERMREELRRKEELVRDFKEKHMGQLPEQMENNYRILTQVQQHIDGINDALQKTEDRKVLVQTQLGRLETWQADSAKATAQGLGAGADEKPESLEQLRQRLEWLRSRYTADHPDVVKLQATIAKMEKEQEASQPASDSESSASDEAASKADRLMHAQREDLLAQLALIERDIRTLSEEKKKIMDQIQVYRERIENGPRIEQMFVDLRRGYQEAYENYQSLLQKRMSAELAENLERTQKGEQFKILEPANLPRRPVKPNVLRLLSIGLMLALTLGFGLALAREHLDPTFWRRKDLESVIQLPVIISIPVVATRKEKRRRLLKRTGAAGVLVSMACILVYALIVLWQRVPMEWLLSGP
jgi:polysaccharide chain length determinant protein (PEP-CTERM system associated)